jgi:hypothetical protein
MYITPFWPILQPRKKHWLIKHTKKYTDVLWDLKNRVENVLMKTNVCYIHVKMVEDVETINHQDDMNVHVTLDMLVKIVNWNYQHQHFLVHLLVLFLH